MRASLVAVAVEAAVLLTLAVPGFLRMFGEVDSVGWRVRQAGVLGMAFAVLGFTAGAALAARALVTAGLHPLVVAAAACVPLALLPFAVFVVALYVDQRRVAASLD